jgi:hypothetical protein
MKKLILFFVLAVTACCASAQNPTDGGGVSHLDSCFCCYPNYNLPKPRIQGPTRFCCEERPTYSISKCEGASISWTTSPAGLIAGPTNGPTITLISPIPVSTFTITVTIKCGNNASVSSTITVIVDRPQSCDAAYVLATQEIDATHFQVTGIPSSPHVPSKCKNDDFFYLTKIDCNTGNNIAYVAYMYYPTSGTPISSDPAHVNAGTSGHGFQDNNLDKGTCYRLYHYVYCCGKWSYVSKTFTMNNSAKMAGGAQFRTEENSGTVEPNALPREVQLINGSK